MIRSLNTLYDDFPSQNAAYLDHFRRDCLTVGNPIKVISGAGERIGTATGISDDFGLTVRWEDGSTETLTSERSPSGDCMTMCDPAEAGFPQIQPVQTEKLPAEVFSAGAFSYHVCNNRRQPP